MKLTNLTGKRVAVIGAARSGIAVSRLLVAHGASVLLSEKRSMLASEVAILRELGVNVETGGHTQRTLASDFIVVSPGVPTDTALVRQALHQNIPVYSELEVASWFCKAKVVAITGTNGKSTTCTLLHTILNKAGHETSLAGNIGDPLSNHVTTASENGVIVLEVSSFQLDHIESFRPAVSVLLNITPDHLDRYGGSFENYAQAKFRLLENQREGDTVVYNHDDALVRRQARHAARAHTLRTVGFSFYATLTNGVFIENDTVVQREDGRATSILDMRDPAYGGRGRVRNCLAAIAAARALEIDSEVVRESLQRFQGLAHRMEFVRDLDGVRYINDSKATNVNALWYALETMDRKVVLLAGGRDKGNDYSKVVPLVEDKVDAVVGFGEGGAALAKELGRYARDVRVVSTLEDAMEAAKPLARPGTVVLLSPACSSLDQFEDYTHRGNAFKSIVKTL